MKEKYVTPTIIQIEIEESVILTSSTLSWSDDWGVNDGTKFKWVI